MAPYANISVTVALKRNHAKNLLLVKITFQKGADSYTSYREINFKKTQREILYLRNTLIDITKLTHILNKGTIEKSWK